MLIPAGYIHLKTDSPDLYQFTKRVIEMYNLVLIKDCDDVYAKNNSPELKIKTHYESLDIAQSNKVFYLKFQLPSIIVDLDDALQEEIKITEQKD